MEIAQRQPFPSAPSMDDLSGTTGRHAASETSAMKAGAIGANGKALLHAARELLDAQDKRYGAHAKLQAEVTALQKEAAKARDSGTDGVNSLHLEALRVALDGVALSEKLDRPREKAAIDAHARLMPGAGDTPAASAYADAEMASGQNLGEIWQELADMIGTSQDGELAEYAAALDKYTALYQSLSDIMAKLGGWVRADGDNYMRVDFGNLYTELDNLVSAYDNPTQDKVIAGKAPSGGISEAEAKDVCERLGLDPKECVHRNNDGTYCVVPDVSQVRKMIEGLPSTQNNYQISIASYNAWKAGFDSQMSRVEDALQTRGQKYSNAYSRFENFHKTISSIIQTMADMLRQFLQF